MATYEFTGSRAELERRLSELQRKRVDLHYRGDRIGAQAADDEARALSSILNPGSTDPAERQ